MFNRALALATVAALFSLGPVAAQARTHHAKKHHMMMSGSTMQKKAPCRDKKTGRFMKCKSSMSGSM